MARGVSRIIRNNMVLIDLGTILIVNICDVWLLSGDAVNLRFRMANGNLFGCIRWSFSGTLHAPLSREWWHRCIEDELATCIVHDYIMFYIRYRALCCGWPSWWVAHLHALTCSPPISTSPPSLPPNLSKPSWQETEGECRIAHLAPLNYLPDLPPIHNTMFHWTAQTSHPSAYCLRRRLEPELFWQRHFRGIDLGYDRNGEERAVTTEEGALF